MCATVSLTVGPLEILICLCMSLCTSSVSRELVKGLHVALKALLLNFDPVFFLFFLVTVWMQTRVFQQKKKKPFISVRVAKKIELEVIPRDSSLCFNEY